MLPELKINRERMENAARATQIFSRRIWLITS
jgi:hypothetical protein